jgi:hypothetical protein
MSHPKLFAKKDTSLLHVFLYEMQEKKSKIFSLAFHTKKSCKRDNEV